VEGAAPADLAVDANGATHELDQTGRDRETDTGTTVASGRRTVSLHERLEDAALLLGGMPMPVSATLTCSTRPQAARSCATATVTVPCA
jgi:hypothetical protein